VQKFEGTEPHKGRNTVSGCPLVPTLSSPRRLEKNCEDTPTSPEVIDAHMLNFKPNFKFFTIKNFWVTSPSQFGLFGCTLARLDQSLARVKISGRRTTWPTGVSGGGCALANLQSRVKGDVKFSLDRGAGMYVPSEGAYRPPCILFFYQHSFARNFTLEFWLGVANSQDLNLGAL